MDDGLAAVEGELSIPGVHGTGAPVKLEFRDPGGAGTGKLLPTGNVVDTLDVPGVGKVKASMVDAANACVFVSAADIGLKGTEMPDDIDASPEIQKKLEAIRRAASVAMGMAPDAEAAGKKSGPFIGFVSPPQDAKLLTGEALKADSVDLTARMMSNGQPHRALPLTASLCIAVAARIEGSLVHAAARRSDDPEAPLRIAMPSGVLTVASSVHQRDGQWVAEQGALLRTQRRLFDGNVYVRDTPANSRQQKA
jgi:2-methylaconitate cis-trans-isomerase PrpF